MEMGVPTSMVRMRGGHHRSFHSLDSLPFAPTITFPLSRSLYLVHPRARARFLLPEGETYGCEADVWSLGISLLELATLAFPFENTGVFALIIQITSDEPAPALPDRCVLLLFSSALLLRLHCMRLLVQTAAQGCVLHVACWDCSAHPCHCEGVQCACSNATHSHQCSTRLLFLIYVRAR